ncbi:MAG: lamin tail domain-containing protein [Muribaculaceae bacterium]|nr:lamin tail domain-containing protein [Muribaculaceae bacterium]
MRRILLFSALAGAVLSLPLTASAGHDLLFKESFANCKSSTIQGGYFTESLYFDAPTMGDNDGWYTQNCYMSERAIKFSAKTKHGKATTPAITASSDAPGDITVYFRAQNWSGDDLTINVSVAGHPEMTQTVDISGLTQISDRSQQGSSVTFSGLAESEFKLEFSGTGKEGGSGVTRFFLSDIEVYEDVPDGEEKPAVHLSTSYFHFNDIMAGNMSEIHTLKYLVNGMEVHTFDPETHSNHKDLIDIWMEAPEKSNFRCVADLTDNGCNIPWSFFFMFDPRSAGSKEETYVLHAGDMTYNIILTGNAKVYRPDAPAPFDVTSDSFNLPGLDAPGIEEFELAVWTVEEDKLVAPDLMITKYIEGKSNNRALEIFNGTGHAVNLGGYRLLMESNGAGGLTACEFAFPDVELADGKCYTIANAQFGAVRDIADKTIGYQDGGYANIMTFTGDDAIGLFNPEGELIDLVGYESTDVNDRVSGVWGTDVSYYRRPESCMPTPKFYPSEWIKYPMDYCEGFGAHEMDAYGDVRRVVNTQRVVPEQETVSVTGLKPQTTYHYAVRGFSNGLTTHFSPEMTITTLSEGSGVQNVSEAPLYTISGRTIVLAEGAEAYAVDGTLLGSGTIAPAGHGILVIRRDTQALKLRY